MSKPIDLYSFATPNGQKISIALEEMGLAYVAHVVNIGKGDQFKPEFLRVNPNGKIPAIVDPDGPGGPLNVFESGAILIYLAEKSGQLLGTDPRARSEALQWLFFQVGGVGPMFGQFGHFYKHARAKCDHPYPLERYATETKRLLGVMDRRLAQSPYLAGAAYSIADVATVTWVNALTEFYGAGELLELNAVPNVTKWRDQILARPAVQRGMAVCRP